MLNHIHSFNPNAQYELYCPTCRRQTRQAHLTGLEFSCTICTETHTIEDKETHELLKAIMQTMSEHQRLEKQFLIV